MILLNDLKKFLFFRRKRHFLFVKYFRKLNNFERLWKIRRKAGNVKLRKKNYSFLYYFNFISVRFIPSLVIIFS